MTFDFECIDVFEITNDKVVEIETNEKMEICDGIDCSITFNPENVSIENEITGILNSDVDYMLIMCL